LPRASGAVARLTWSKRSLCFAETEAATVANNCAAALVLILRHFTSGERKEVIISRGRAGCRSAAAFVFQKFSKPVARRCARSHDQQDSLRDYERAIGPATAMILKVHQSNFFMGGFVESPSTEEISALTRKKRIPFVEDLGSGAVIETEKELGPRRITSRRPPKCLAGCGLVCFSGDKLLGGPQAALSPATRNSSPR